MKFTVQGDVTLHMTFKLLLCLVEGYLIGSVSISILISKYLFHQDVRTMGSGNAGAANAARTYGPVVGALTFGGDFLKGVIAAAIGLCLCGTYGYAVAAAACLIGHCFPVYFGFKGGKAVSTAAGITLLLDWRVFLTAFVVFIIVAFLTRTASASSMSAAVAIAVSTPIFNRNPALICLAVFMCLLVLLMHRGNIQRILQGTEPKFHFGSRPPK